jgi:hypothetical protein
MARPKKQSQEGIIEEEEAPSNLLFIKATKGTLVDPTGKVVFKINEPTLVPIVTSWMQLQIDSGLMSLDSQ